MNSDVGLPTSTQGKHALDTLKDMIKENRGGVYLVEGRSLELGLITLAVFCDGFSSDHLKITINADFIYEATKLTRFGILSTNAFKKRINPDAYNICDDILLN